MLQAPQESGPGQHREAPEAHPATASRCKAPPLRRNGCGGPGGIGRPTIATPSGTQQRFPGSAAQSGNSPQGRRDSGNRSDPDPRLWSTASASALELLNSQAGPEDDHCAAVGDAAVTALQATPSPRKPTFRQRERWKAVQQAQLKGLSIRRMARELGIHRDTVSRCIDAESPPTRRSPIASTAAPSDTIADQPSDISAEHLDGHLC